MKAADLQSYESACIGGYNGISPVVAIMFWGTEVGAIQWDPIHQQAVFQYSKHGLGRGINLLPGSLELTEKPQVINLKTEFSEYFPSVAVNRVFDKWLSALGMVPADYSPLDRFALFNQLRQGGTLGKTLSELQSSPLVHSLGFVVNSPNPMRLHSEFINRRRVLNLSQSWQKVRAIIDGDLCGNRKAAVRQFDSGPEVKLEVEGEREVEREEKQFEGFLDLNQLVNWGCRQTNGLFENPLAVVMALGAGDSIAVPKGELIQNYDNSLSVQAQEVPDDSSPSSNSSHFSRSSHYLVRVMPILSGQEDEKPRVEYAFLKLAESVGIWVNSPTLQWTDTRVSEKRLRRARENFSLEVILSQPKHSDCFHINLCSVCDSAKAAFLAIESNAPFSQHLLFGDYSDLVGVVEKLNLNQESIEQLYLRIVFNLVYRTYCNEASGVSFRLNLAGEWSVAETSQLLFDWSLLRGEWPVKSGFRLNGRILNTAESIKKQELINLGFEIGLTKPKARVLMNQVLDGAAKWQAFADMARIRDSDLRELDRFFWIPI